MDYLVDDAALDAAAFLALANSVWPGEYDVEKTRQALGKTLNITAYHQGQLIGCLRILTDGCYFGTITEVLVLPGPIPRPCYTSGPSQERKAFTKKTAAKRGCRPISSTRHKYGGAATQVAAPPL